MKRKYFGFSLNMKFLSDEKNTDLIARAMSGIIVIKAEHDFITNNIDYTAWHKDAPEIEEGYSIPHADFSILNLEDRFSWKWTLRAWDGECDFNSGFVLKEQLKRAA